MKYDLVVIGGGSGGVACARRSAEYGAKVAIVESYRFGGTCVIRGCVPKKLLMYASDFKDYFEESRDFGWEFGKNLSFNMKNWQDKKTQEISRLEKIYENLLSKSGVFTIKGRGKILDENTVLVNEEKLFTSRIMIATGGLPALRDIDGIEHCITSNQILDLERNP